MPSIGTRKEMIIDGNMDPFSTTLPSTGRYGKENPKKTTHTTNEPLSPGDFGLPDTICSEVKLHQLFEGNKIIIQDRFELKFNCPVNFLSYANLANVIKN